MIVELTVNGEARLAEVRAAESLLDVLRDELELPGSKSACEQGECGSCSVIMDGTLVCSCLVMGADAAGSEVVTVEGLSLGNGSIPCNKPCWRPVRCNAVSALRGSSSPRLRCSMRTPLRAETTYVRRCQGTSAAAPVMEQSCAGSRSWRNDHHHRASSARWHR